MGHSIFGGIHTSLQFSHHGITAPQEFRMLGEVDCGARGDVRGPDWNPPTARNSHAVYLDVAVIHQRGTLYRNGGKGKTWHS